MIHVSPRYYVLNSRHEAVPVEDVLLWAKWYENADRVVKQEWAEQFFVSTIFLGLDHSIGLSDGRPLLFETMVWINSETLNEQERCSTWDESLQMHQRMVAKMLERSRQSEHQSHEGQGPEHHQGDQ